MGGVVSTVTDVAKAVSTVSPGWGTVASLALTGYSQLQQRKQGKRQSQAANKQAELETQKQQNAERYNQAQARRAQVEAQRKARIQQGLIQGQTGNVLGQGGTSGFSGSLGSISSQAANQIGNIGVEQGFASSQGQFNQQIANQQQSQNNAAASGAGWQQVGSLAGTVGDAVDSIFSSPKID